MELSLHKHTAILLSLLGWTMLDFNQALCALSSIISIIVAIRQVLKNKNKKD